MPALPISRANAWTYWCKGQIAATSIYLDADAPDLPGFGQLANVALKRNHNAIRLWFRSSVHYDINEQDIINIALSPNGWDDTSLKTDSGKVALSVVTAQITNVLNVASSLGLGVLPVVDFHQGPEGKIWANEVLPGQATLKYRDALAAFWVKTFRKWRNHPALIGFDILNEPNPESNANQHTFASFRDGTATNPKETRWPAIAQQVITAIRQEEGATASPLPLIVQGIYTGGVEGLGVFDAPPPIAPQDGSPSAYLMDPRGRLVYSFHTYDPLCFGQQGVQTYFYEQIGTPYPLPGAVFIGGWNNGVAYHDLVNFRNADDLARYLKSPADFRAKYQVPIFVGEFSAAQPSINQVWPPMNRTGDAGATYPNELDSSKGRVLTDQEMKTKYQSFRVSNVQNNVAWEAPMLARLATVKTQADFDAIVNMVKSVDPTKPATFIYKNGLEGTGRRWITEIQVDTNGIAGSGSVNVTAVFSHLGDLGFWIAHSNKSPEDIKAARPGRWDMWVYPEAGADFVLKTKAKIMGQFAGLDVVTSNTNVVIDMIAKAYNMASVQDVNITCRSNSIKFSMPVASLPAEVLTQAVKDAIKNGVVSRIQTLTGATVNVTKDQYGNKEAVQMPVALLWLESPYTGEQIDQARLALLRDALHVFQSNGFSWCFFADGASTNISAGFWQPSRQMGEVLATAASGRRLTPRV